MSIVIRLVLRWSSLSPSSHTITTDYANIFSCHLFWACVWVTLVHISSCLSVFDEIVYAFVERADSQSHIAYYVYGHTVEHAQDEKERKVKNKFEEI